MGEMALSGDNDIVRVLIKGANILNGNRKIDDIKPKGGLSLGRLLIRSVGH